MIVFKRITINNFRLAVILSNFTNVKYYKLDIDKEKDKILISLKKRNIIQIDCTNTGQTKDISANFLEQEKVANNFLNKLIKKKSFKNVSELVGNKFSAILVLKMHLYELIFSAYVSCGLVLSFWSSISAKKDKIYYITFDISDVFLPPIKNITKIIIPINIKSLFNFFFKKLNFNQKKKYALSKKNSYNFKVGFLVHKSIQYGNLYQKDYFYSKNKQSFFNKKKIIHFFYSTNVLEKKFNNYILLKSNISIKSLFKYFFVNIFSIKNFLDIYTVFISVKFFLDTQHYESILKQYKSLKLFIIDNETQAPKAFLLALKKLNIKIVALEERSLIKYNFGGSFIGDVYLSSSKYFCKKKYFIVNKIIPIGYPRTDQMSKYKSGKNFILILGLLADNNFYNQKNEILINWESQLFFINQIINLCNSYKQEQFILRYKTIEWMKSKYFLDVRKKILQTKNLEINDDAFSTYKLAQQSKLIVSHYSTIVEEMIFVKKPILVFDYSNNFTYIFKNTIRNGSIPFIFCNSYQELVKKFERVLYNKKFKFNLLNSLRKFMKQPKYLFKSKKTLLKKLESYLQH